MADASSPTSVPPRSKHRRRTKKQLAAKSGRSSAISLADTIQVSNDSASCPPSSKGKRIQSSAPLLPEWVPVETSTRKESSDGIGRVNCGPLLPTAAFYLEPEEGTLPSGEEAATHSVNERDDGVATEDAAESADGDIPCPKNISTDQWERFQKLQERRKQLSTPAPPKKRRKKSHPPPQESPKLKIPYASITPYMNLNTHLQGTDHGRLNPLSALERETNRAVDEGNRELAENLNDEVARRRAEEVVRSALEARDFDRRQKEKEARRQALNSKKSKKRP